MNTNRKGATAMKEATMTVEGEGRMSVEPDVAVISCKITALDPSYATANSELNHRVGSLRQAAVSMGFKRSDLKTTDYRVDRKEERVSQNDSYHQIFLGYEAAHCVELRMPLDRDRVNRMVESFLQADARPEVEVAFAVLDPEPVRMKLLTAAVQTSRQRAEVMAVAGGVSLGKILHIHYGAAEIRVTSKAFKCEDALMEDMFSPDIEPGDFAVQEKVLVTWEILQ